MLRLYAADEGMNEAINFKIHVLGGHNTQASGLTGSLRLSFVALNFRIQSLSHLEKKKKHIKPQRFRVFVVTCLYQF